MSIPFGNTLSLSLSWTRSWLSLGSGWAAVAGALAAGLPLLDSVTVSSLILLWILADPLLGGVWHLTVDQGLWRELVHASLPSPADKGFLVPYAQPGSIAGRLVIRVRQYDRWLREYSVRTRNNLTTLLLASGLSLLIGLYLHRAIFWLVVLVLGLTSIAGFGRYELAAPGGGRLQSVTQFLLPWAVGTMLWQQPSRLALLIGLVYWIVYLGGLRMIGNHRGAEWLFFLGQLTAALILLGLQLLPAAAVTTVLLLSQLIAYKTYPRPQRFLPRIQGLLLLELIVVALAVGIGT